MIRVEYLYIYLVITTLGSVELDDLEYIDISAQHSNVFHRLVVELFIHINGLAS